MTDFEVRCSRSCTLAVKRQNCPPAATASTLFWSLEAADRGNCGGIGEPPPRGRLEAEDEGREEGCGGAGYMERDDWGGDG